MVFLKCLAGFSYPTVKNSREYSGGQGWNPDPTYAGDQGWNPRLTYPDLTYAVYLFYKFRLAVNYSASLSSPLVDFIRVKM